MQRSALCRSRRELSNEYLLAKFGFDTAENEPFQVCPLSAYRSPRFGAGDDAWSSSNFGDDPLVEEADDSNANPFDSALARRLGQDKAARPSAPMPPARPAAPAPAGAARP